MLKAHVRICVHCFLTFDDFVRLEVVQSKSTPAIGMSGMWNFIVCSLLVFLPCACVADFYEMFEKVSSQAWSFVSFATRTEQNLHDCMHKEVSYYLYSKGGKEQRIFNRDLAGLNRSGFNHNLPTVMVVHGYTDSRKRAIIVRLRSELVDKLDANVIVVDWHRAAGQIYFTAVSNTYHAGEQLGEFLQFLEDVGYDLDKVHLIGHSLGAQISGVAGGRVEGRVGRITGLDPAGPLFEFIDKRNTSMSLDKSDARFVDVIHSAMGSFGVIKPIGHADFYPNDGLAPQPGCTNIILAVSCSHIRSVDFFVESLDKTLPKYMSRSCTTWKEYHLFNCSKENVVPMGYYTPRR